MRIPGLVIFSLFLLLLLIYYLVSFLCSSSPEKSDKYVSEVYYEFSFFMNSRWVRLNLYEIPPNLCRTILPTLNRNCYKGLSIDNTNGITIIAVFKNKNKNIFGMSNTITDDYIFVLFLFVFCFALFFVCFCFLRVFLFVCLFVFCIVFVVVVVFFFFSFFFFF